MGDQWVIMEYVSGESLEDVIERNPNGMPIEQALWWMRGMCGGVAYLHDHGIVHRDLKPGNIFSDEGTVKIGDYGLAKFISCSRRSGQTESVGTVHYMAPEIANGRYGREIDTYALGIILFEMLTGRVPFEGESVGEVLMKHLTAEPDLTRTRGAVSRHRAAGAGEGSERADQQRRRDVVAAAGLGATCPACRPCRASRRCATMLPIRSRRNTRRRRVDRAWDSRRRCGRGARVRAGRQRQARLPDATDRGADLEGDSRRLRRYQRRSWNGEGRPAAATAAEGTDRLRGVAMLHLVLRCDHPSGGAAG